MSDSLFETGIRPHIDAYLKKKSEEKRDYGGYWSASSAGYCMRRLIMERLGVPRVAEIDARTTRVFEVGHVFHQFMQDITRASGLSIAQETELIDNKIMVKGHFDDLIDIKGKLILYDYKSQASGSFTKGKDKAISHFHRCQVATYIYMLRKDYPSLAEGRILKISKDDLRMAENQVLWTPALEKEIVNYWSTLNGYWNSRRLPRCTCGDYEGGFLARPKFNPYYYKEEPCSLAWLELTKREGRWSHDEKAKD